MKVHILMNALDYGDAVSTHCILLKRRAGELGIPADLYAEFAHPDVAHHVTALPLLSRSATDEDILLHQLYNATPLMPFVREFPGRRILMYHNITPPAYFERQGEAYSSCVEGLRLMKSLTGLYDCALGMSEFSRRDLEQSGYSTTGVFPLMMDLDALGKRAAEPILIRQRNLRTTFLFVGRIAPNKRIDDLLRCIAACRAAGRDVCLRLVGDDSQHAAYVQGLHSLARDLDLHPGVDVIFTGKVPESHLVAYFRTADAFLCMSEHEGFCAPLIESMVFGLPTFAYAAGACEETMGGAGVVFANKDFHQIARKIFDVLDDERRREEVLESQRRRLDAFSPERQRQMLASLVVPSENSASFTRVRSRKVSVVINTCNRGHVLPRCLASLQEQTFRNFEVIVVNGPSTDNTASVLEQFSGQIRVVTTASRVLCVSRNEGIVAARGDLVAFIDDDAIAEPRWLEGLVGAFEDPAVGAAGGLVFRMNGRDIEFRNGVLDRYGFVAWNEARPGTHWDWKQDRLNTVSGNNCMFRRSALEKLGGFDEKIEYYHDEADVVMRLAKAGYRTVHRPDAIVYHEAAASHNRPSKYELNWFVIVKNTLYCALKNYDGRLPRRAIAWRVLRAVLRERMAPMFEWRRKGFIGSITLFRLEWLAAKGVSAGLWNGLRPKPLYREIAAFGEDAELLVFPRGKARQLSVCLLSQALPAESPGGIATYTWNLARGLHDLGCEVHVVTRGNHSAPECRDGIWVHRVERAAFRHSVVNGSFPTAATNLEYSNAIHKTILDIDARWGVDIVESPNWDVEGIVPALDHRLPVVVRVHSPMFKVMETQGWEQTEDLRLCAEMEGTLIRHACAVTGSTRAILSLVSEKFPVGAKASLLPLGIAPPDEQFGTHVDSISKYVLFVGRLEHRKGIRSLLKAIPSVLNATRNVEFRIAGRDSDAGDGHTWRERWERAGSAFNGRVKFLGEVGEADLHELYSNCAIFVAPSQYESFGLIYVEAMAHGKPVIACRTGGVPEVVVDGETGFLVPVDDPPSLAEAILRLATDEGLCRQLGSAGRARYEREFSAKIMATRTLDLYRRLCSDSVKRDASVWRATAPDFLRHSACQIVWAPEARQTCLLAEPGMKRTAVYGPYIPIPAGSYRAQFKLWLGAVPAVRSRLGAVDVLNLEKQQNFERAFTVDDFSGGSGRVLDVFFSVTDPSSGNWEFRVITDGIVPLYIREIAVTHWPHSALAGDTTS